MQFYSGRRTKSRSLIPPKPPIAKIAQGKREFGMTKLE